MLGLTQTSQGIRIERGFLFHRKGFGMAVRTSSPPAAGKGRLPCRRRVGGAVDKSGVCIKGIKGGGC